MSSWSFSVIHSKQNFSLSLMNHSIIISTGTLCMVYVCTVTQSLSLFRELHNGGVDPLKAIKLKEVLISMLLYFYIVQS